MTKKIDENTKLLMSAFESGTNSFIQVVNHWRAYARKSHPEKLAEIEDILKRDDVKLQFLLEVTMDGRPFVCVSVKEYYSKPIFLFNLDGKNDAKN